MFSRCRMFCGFGLLFMMVLFLVMCLFLNMMIWWYFGISFLCFELLVFLMIRCCLFLVFLLKLMMFECLVRIVGFFGLCVLNRLVMCGRLLVMLWVLDVFCGILVIMLFMLMVVLFCRLMMECGGNRYWVGRLVFGMVRLLFLVFMICMIGCRFLVCELWCFGLVILCEVRLVSLLVFLMMVMLLMKLMKWMKLVILDMIGWLCGF